MGFFNVIDKMVEPITKEIFPPEENWFEAPNYVEFQRRRYNSALTGASFIFKAIAVCFVIYVMINVLSGEDTVPDFTKEQKELIATPDEAFNKLSLFDQVKIDELRRIQKRRNK